MFKNAVALNKDRHGALRFTPQASRSFAAQEQLIPLVAGEAAEAAKEHVIAFVAGAQPALPVLLTGVDPRTNAYVAADGSWLASYVPAYVRSYPFVLSEQSAAANASEVQRRFTVCVVPEAPHFAVGSGEPLFQDDGAPAPVLLKAQSVLAELQKDAERTQFLVQQLIDLNLLREQVVPVVYAQGRAKGVQGLRVLDMARFKSLEPAQEVALRETGALALVHAHVTSLRNLERGVLAQQAGVAQGGEPSAFIDPDLFRQAREKAAQRRSASSPAVGIRFFGN